MIIKNVLGTVKRGDSCRIRQYHLFLCRSGVHVSKMSSALITPRLRATDPSKSLLTWAVGNSNQIWLIDSESLSQSQNDHICKKLRHFTFIVRWQPLVAVGIIPAAREGVRTSRIKIEAYIRRRWGWTDELDSWDRSSCPLWNQNVLMSFKVLTKWSGHRVSHCSSHVGISDVCGLWRHSPSPS